MPKVVHRFLAFLTVVLLLQVVSSIPDFVAGRGGVGAVKLVACLFSAMLAFAAVHGYDGPRKVIAFFSCLGGAGALCGVLAGLYLAAKTMSPISVVIVAVSMILFFLELGVYKAVTDDSFKRWVTGKAIQRAEAKYAGA